MKTHTLAMVWLTTIFVFVFAFLCYTNTLVNLLPILLVMGQLEILYMVYTVLKDDQNLSKKTFDDWYENK